MEPNSGDVVRSTDPFKLGRDRQRPWLVVSNDSHPNHGEQFIAVAVSTREYRHSLPLLTEVWETGGVPRESFVSPWAVHSPRIEDLETWQGRVAGEFVERIVAEVETYLT